MKKKTIFSIFILICIISAVGYKVGYPLKQKINYKDITFDEISDFSLKSDVNGDVIPTIIDKQLPPHIKNLNNQHVKIKGYMLPTNLGSGKITSFLLFSTQMGCCFGMTTNISEWIYVTMAEGKSISIEEYTKLQDKYIPVSGQLYVGEKSEGSGDQEISLYRMTAHKVERAQ